MFDFVVQVRGMRERSPPLPKIAHPSLPRLGRSQASTQQSAMPESPPGGTAWLITVSPVPGKLTSTPCSVNLYSASERNTYGFSSGQTSIHDGFDHIHQLFIAARARALIKTSHVRIAHVVTSYLRIRARARS